MAALEALMVSLPDPFIDLNGMGHWHHQGISSDFETGR